jgi:hypothetical protein
MKLLPVVAKQPDERLRRVLDYTEAAIVGDTVGSAVVKEIRPAGLVVDGIIVTGQQVFFWLSGGANQVKYTVEFTVTMDPSGEIFEDEVIVNVKEIL